MDIRRIFERFRGERENQESNLQEPEYLTSLPAPTDGDYPLRAEQEEQLYRALCQRGRHILLHGPGGTGKTHMARKLFYRLSREYPRLAWVEYGTGIRHSMARSPGATSGNPDQWFDQFIRKLEEAARDTILFIDDAKEDAMDDDVLSQITGMGITILMTSRCPEISPYETWELEPVSADECADLFYANYRQDPRRQYRKTVLALADQLGQNVFAMLLLANVAGEPGNLPHIEERLRKGTLMDHIGQLMDASRLTEGQQQILHCLSLTTSGELLEDLVSWMEFPESDVNALITGGWLIRNRKNKCLVLHDLVREYWNQELPDRQTVEYFIKGALGANFHRGAKAHSPAAFKGKALDFQGRALELMEQYWDSEENLAEASNNVGIAFSKFGDHRRALEYTRKALMIREQMLPPDYPKLATSYNNMGTTYNALGDHVTALEYHFKALAIRERVLPPNHPALAVSYGNVGTTYGNLGDHTKALKYHLRAMEIHEKVLPSDHPDLAISYGNVGTTYGDLGDHAKALEYKLKAMEIHEKTLPSDHPHLAISYNNVGTTYGDLGDHTRALKFKLKDLAISEKVLPLEHPDLATSYNNVGYTYGKLGDHSKELEYYRKALTIREKVLESDHPDLAASYNNVGYAYGKLGNQYKQLEYYHKAQAILEKVLPQNHPDIAASCNNIAAAYAAQEQYGTALEWMRRALEIAENSLPEDHPTRKSYREGIERLEKQC